MVQEDKAKDARKSIQIHSKLIYRSPLNDGLLVASAARECSIFLAPAAELREIDLLLDPLAATLFDVPHQVAQRHRRRQLDEHVDMVADAIDAIQTATTALDDRPDIAIEVLTGLVGNGHLAPIGVDDNVKDRTDCTHGFLRLW